MNRKHLDATINQYGDYRIDKLRIVRKPLKGQTILNLLVGKPRDHDKYYHLYQEMSLVNSKGERKVLMIEKNQRIKIESRTGGLSEGVEARNIALPEDRSITFKEYVRRGKEAHAVAEVPYHRYSLKRANCQLFTMLNLRGNGLGDMDDMRFIDQKAHQIVPRHLEVLTDFITDRAGEVTWKGNS